MLKQKFVQETLSQQSYYLDNYLDNYLDRKDDKITFHMMKNIREYFNIITEIYKNLIKYITEELNKINKGNNITKEQAKEKIV